MNPNSTNFKSPRGVGGLPHQPKSLGGLLTFFGALYDEDIHAVYIRRTLNGYQSVLTSPHVYIPHDVVVPGALTGGDLCEIAAVIAPRPLRLDRLVDGLNRRVPTAPVQQSYRPTIEGFRSQNARDRIELGGTASLATRLLDHQ